MSAPTRACTISGAGGPTKIGSGTLVLPGANTYSAVPRARRRHAQPCQQPSARDRRADQRRLAGPISPTASPSPIRSRADAFLQIGPWRPHGKRRRAGKREPSGAVLTTGTLGATAINAGGIFAAGATGTPDT
jgi:hypothetical protein